MITVALGILLAIGVVITVAFIVTLVLTEMFLYKVSGFTVFHRLWFWLRRDHE